ncbi:MAG TPA: hypothetical protein VK550_08285 [Polyangiaceae bacterium]|jgi:hypothetical protein|nr:hypothetical protein [Polyangiaceae bacterium]
MAVAPNVSRAPSLFAHKNRKDWGVGVLAWEADGKRGYLFDNGEERTMASGFFELMRRVEQPNAEQSAAYTRLQRILAARANASETARRGATFADHVEKFRETYAEGLQDAKWLVEVRGEGAERRAPRHRDAAISEAKEQLSASALDALISGQKHEQLWNLVTSVLGRTDLVPSAQLRKPKSVTVEQQRGLAVAARELLYGKTPYEQRFERYLGALAAFYGEPARWEIATALSAIVHPAEHVCVQPAVFRQQLKASGSTGTVAARPSNAAYAKLLVNTRFVGSQLTGQGEAPRDLLDVLDFIRIALKPPAKIRVAKAGAVRASRRTTEDDDTAGSDETAGNEDD